MIIWMAVQIATGRIDYETMSYMFTSKPEGAMHKLVPEWEWREFNVTPDRLKDKAFEDLLKRYERLVHNFYDGCEVMPLYEEEFKELKEAYYENSRDSKEG